MQIDFLVKTDRSKDKHILIFLKKRNKIINIFLIVIQYIYFIVKYNSYFFNKFYLCQNYSLH